MDVDLRREVAETSPRPAMVLQIQCEVKPWATQGFGHDGRFVS